jgi:hypothetical protein
MRTTLAYFLTALGATVALVALVGTAQFMRGTQVQRIDRPFEGLAAHTPAPASDRLLHVLMVHGIGRHCVGYADDFADALAERLGLVALGARSRIEEWVHRESARQCDAPPFAGEAGWRTTRFDRVAASLQGALAEPTRGDEGDDALSEVLASLKEVVSGSGAYSDPELAAVDSAARDRLKATLRRHPAVGDDFRSIATSIVAARDGLDVDMQRGFCEVYHGAPHESCQRIVGYYVNTRRPIGYLRTRDYGEATGDAVALRFYELTWDPATRPIKEKYLHGFDANREAVRASLNHALKRELINDTITDAVMYLGEFKATILSPLLASLCRIASSGRDSEIERDAVFACDPDRHAGAAPFAERNDVVIITHSLGTRMTFDALGRLAAPGESDAPWRQQQVQGQAVWSGFSWIDEAVGEALLPSLRQVFTMANQIPLIQVGRIEDPKGHLRDAGLGENFALAVSGEGPERNGVPWWEDVGWDSMQVVGFTDPNDPLSYNLKCAYYWNVLRRRARPQFLKELRAAGLEDECSDATFDLAWKKAPSFLTLVDVSMNLAPPLLGFGANPLAAHSKYFTDPTVADLIACGGDPDTGARDCAEARSAGPAPTRSARLR